MTNATPLMPTPMARHRFHFLDILRGLAALVVVVWHAPAILQPRLFPVCGFLAVDFFFCLSGFVVAFAYESRLKDKLSFADFTVARTIRLYPMYLLGTVLGIAIDLHQSPHGMGAAWQSRRSALLVACNLVMVPNIAIWPNIILYPFDNPAWSLFYELGANILYGAAVRLRIAFTWMFPVVAVVSFVLLWRGAAAGKVLLMIGWPNTLAVQGLGWARIALPFSLGVTALRLHRMLPRYVLPAFAQTVLAVVIVAALVYLLFHCLPIASLSAENSLCASLLFPLFVLLGANVSVHARLASVAALLGDISYPVYLLHMPFMHLLAGTTFPRLAAVHPVLLKLTLPALMLFLVVLAVAIVRIYETPVRHWLSRRYASWKATSNPTMEAAAASS